MKNLLSIIVLCGIVLTGYGQEPDIITLQKCYSDACMASPVAAEKQLLNHVYQLKDKNISSAWLPSVDAGATIMYNTSVVDLTTALESLPLPLSPGEISGMPHDQYKLTVDINQVIYDGGVTRGSREAEMASLKYNEKSVDADLYKIREQVNNTFFGLVLLRKQVALLQIYRELIEERMASVSNAVENGVLLVSDLDIIRSEKVKIEQQITESEIRMSALFAILSDLTGREYSRDAVIILPDPDPSPGDTIERAELQLFDLRADQLESTRAIYKSSRLPKAFGFATLGWGSPPGNDFFSDSFGPYAILGAGVKWTITDWNRSKRNEQMIDLNKSIVESRKDDLEGNIRRALEVKKAEIDGLKALLESDDQLISIRKSVTEATGLKLGNGVISATEYMTELNAEKQAMLNRELHLVTLSKARTEYLYITGKEVE